MGLPTGISMPSVTTEEGNETMGSRSPTIELESGVDLPEPTSRHAQTDQASLVVSLGAPRVSLSARAVTFGSLASLTDNRFRS